MTDRDLMNELIEEQDLLGEEMEGLDGLGESFPVIQWANDANALEQRPADKRGGFIMTEDNMELAGDYPKGAEVNAIEFKANDENPDGVTSVCVYSPTLKLIPLGTRTAWFADGKRLPKDFDWDAAVAKYTDNPRSKRQIRAVVDGENGPFVAVITFSSTVAKDAISALRAHTRNVQVVLKKSGIKNRSLKNNGWRWFWMTLEAAPRKMRGEGDKKSWVTPVVLNETGGYIGSALRSEFFDRDEIQAFEDAWNSDPVEDIEQATLPPQQPEYYDDIPPQDDTIYDNDIPF